MAQYSYLVKYTFLKSNGKMVSETIKSMIDVLSKYKTLCSVSGEKPLRFSINKNGRFKHTGENLIFEVIRFQRGWKITP